MTSFSFFKKNIKPEWEDEANRDGITLSTRLQLQLSEVEALWTFVTRDCVRGVLDDSVNGIHISKKMSRHVMSVKFDVWLCRTPDVARIQSELNEMGKAWHVDFQEISRGS